MLVFRSVIISLLLTIYRFADLKRKIGWLVTGYSAVITVTKWTIHVPMRACEAYKSGQVLFKLGQKNDWYKSKCFFSFLAIHLDVFYFFKTILKGNNFVKLSWVWPFESIRFGQWRRYFLVMAVHGVILPLCWRLSSRPWRFCVFERWRFWVSLRIMRVKPFIGEIFADLWSWGYQEVWPWGHPRWSGCVDMVEVIQIWGHKLYMAM